VLYLVVFHGSGTSPASSTRTSATAPTIAKWYVAPLADGVVVVAT
jgi:hypothetical protein